MTDKVVHFCAGCFVYCFAVVFHGWAICLLWSWFILPRFSTPPLGLLEAVGLSFFISLFIPGLSGALKPAYILPISQRLVHAAVSPLVTVGVGWVIKQLM